MVARPVPNLDRLLPDTSTTRGLTRLACAALPGSSASQPYCCRISGSPGQPAAHLPILALGKSATARPACGHVPGVAELRRNHPQHYRSALAYSSERLPAPRGAHPPRHRGPHIRYLHHGSMRPVWTILHLSAPDLCFPCMEVSRALAVSPGRHLRRVLSGSIVGAHVSGPGSPHTQGNGRQS